ncbi:MAG: hypothetical protein ABIG45_05185 [Bacillota bacterium]
MKKIILLLLVMVFAFSAAAADGQVIQISEDQDGFDLFLTLPENASVVSMETDEYHVILSVAIEGKENLAIKIVSAPDELYADRSLADLSDEEIASIVLWYTEEMILPGTEAYVSEDGHDYIVLNENYGGNDSCETITLILGYHIMISVTNEDYSVLSEEDMGIGGAIMETLQVVNK